MPRLQGTLRRAVHLRLSVSATGRGAVRRAHDAYATPPWCVRRLLEAVALPRGLWVEPSAGDGGMVVLMRPHADRILAMELRRACRAPLVTAGADEVWIGNALHRDWPDAAVYLLNPPYRSTDAFVRRAVAHGDHALALLRLGWLAARPRANWLTDHMPDVWLMTERPSFDGTGKRDASAYAWMHWHAGAEGRFRYLAATPPSERRP